MKVPSIKQLRDKVPSIKEIKTKVSGLRDDISTRVPNLKELRNKVSTINFKDLHLSDINSSLKNLSSKVPNWKELTSKVNGLKELNLKMPNLLANSHINTIFPVYIAQNLKVRYVRERLHTPDDDFIDCDWVNENVTDKPTVILFHGTEGNSQSHYAKRIMYYLKSIGWRGVVPHFRGCSEEMNKSLKFYSANDTSDMTWIINQIKARTPNALFASGVSLGGNLLLKYLGENSENKLIDAAFAISVPFKLDACVNTLDNGFFNRNVYAKYFLSSLLPKIKEKAEAFEQAPKVDHKIKSLFDFNNLYISPVYGFKDAQAYHDEASCIDYLIDIKTPALILQAENDPMIPIESWPKREQLSKSIRFVATKTGGHAGFITLTKNYTEGLFRLPKFMVQYFNQQIEAERFDNNNCITLEELELEA